MGIYYGVTVGYGFEAPLENIKNLPEYAEIGWAEEALDSHLYGNGYKTLTFASAHGYDAGDEETGYAIGVNRLTEGYDLGYQNFPLVILDNTSPELLDDEAVEVQGILHDLGMDPATPLVPFVASYMS